MEAVQLIKLLVSWLAYSTFFISVFHRLYSPATQRTGEWMLICPQRCAAITAIELWGASLAPQKETPCPSACRVWLLSAGLWLSGSVHVVAGVLLLPLYGWIAVRCVDRPRLGVLVWFAPVGCGDGAVGISVNRLFS